MKTWEIGARKDKETIDLLSKHPHKTCLPCSQQGAELARVKAEYKEATTKWLEECSEQSVKYDALRSHVDKMAEAVNELKHTEQCTDANNCCADDCFCGYDDVWRALASYRAFTKGETK